MNNEEKILQLLEAQQEELRKINGRLGGMESRMEGMESRMEGMESRMEGIESRMEGIESRLDKLEEHAEITRAGVNSLLEWAEECGNVIKFPLPKVK